MLRMLYHTDEPIVKEKQSTSVDTSIPIVENTCLRSYPPLPMQGSTPAGNTPVVPVESIRAVSERFANTAYGFFLGKRVAYLVFSSMDGLNAMLENGPWCNVQVEYEWKPPGYACCKVFGHIQEECPKNPGLGVVKNLKKPSHTSRGVPLGPKVSFKPAKEYRPILKKPTANTSGIKKKGTEPTKEGSNSNLFGVLNSVDNDERTSNLASNVANSSGFSFWNVETSSIRTTPIVDRIRKIEKLIVDGKLTLVDNDGKPLKKVDYPGDHDSEDEVESVDNDMARSMASERVGFGTKSLLEQWSDSYENDDYDEDPYDDDMNEGQDLPDKIQDICDNLDIRVRGHRKK
ncbi:hypothetical protein Tco_1302228 [Tanacetum coccineum]